MTATPMQLVRKQKEVSGAFARMATMVMEFPALIETNVMLLNMGVKQTRDVPTQTGVTLVHVQKVVQTVVLVALIPFARILFSQI